MELISLYKAELSPKEIFNSMIKNIYDFSPNKSSSNMKYLNIRSKLIKLISQISSKLCFKSQTYFLSIYYLDIIFTKNKKIDLKYNIIALTCLLLSAKHCENDPFVPALKYFIKIYNKLVGIKNNITGTDLFYSEVMTIKSLNHKLNYFTIYDFNSFFFSHNILTKEQLITIDNNFDMNSLNQNILNDKNKVSAKVKKVYDKIYLTSRYYLDIIMDKEICIKYSSLLIAIFILKKSIEIILSQEKCYNYINSDDSTKKKFLIKTHHYFNNIIKGYYGYDYESMPEYNKLINEYDIIQIFGLKKKELNNKNSNNNNTLRQNKTLTSFNKNFKYKYNNKEKKSNQGIESMNYIDSKLNLNKLKSNNNITTKIKKINSLNYYNEQNQQKINYINNKDNNNVKNNDLMSNKLNNKTIYNQNNGNNIIMNNYFSVELNYPQNNFDNTNNIKEKENKIISSHNILNSDKKISRKFQNNFIKNNNIQFEFPIKKSKSKELENDNFDDYLYINDIDNENKNEIPSDLGRLTQSINGILTKHNNQNQSLNKPYYKKVVQNYGNKLKNKNFNQSSNKYNFDNININPYYIEEKEKEQINNNITTNNKLSNKYISKYALNTDSKPKNNINKEFNHLLNKDFIRPKFSHSNNKQTKMSKLLHINLNPKIIEDINTPLNTLYVNKKSNEEIVYLNSQINKSNIKKNRNNNLARSIDFKNKFNNFQERITYLINNQNNQLHPKQIDKNKFNNYINDVEDINENFFSNTLTSSIRGINYPLMKSKKEKINDKKTLINKNKIYFLDNAFSGDENHEYIRTLNKKKNYNNSLSKIKKIQVKKNLFDNEMNVKEKSEEKYRYKRIKSGSLINPSTIVINNNINITFGNKSNNGFSDKNKYGPNSISSLLHKIPLCYKTADNDSN